MKAQWNTGFEEEDEVVFQTYFFEVSVKILKVFIFYFNVLFYCFYKII